MAAATQEPTLSSDDTTSPRPTAGEAATGTPAPTVEQLGSELSDGLYRLAAHVGRIEELVLEAGGMRSLDHDTRLALDQAHSNATAIVATLGRLGFG